MNRKALGKGISALIPDFDLDSAAQNAPSGGAVEMLISEITPNARQPRKYFDDEKLEELARSIKEHGVIQPVIVQKSESGYELIVGERRWRASQKAGLKKIPVIIKEVTSDQSLKLALIENLNRQDLNPIEEAEAFDRLASEFELTQEQIGEAMGRSRTAITNALRLLKLPRPVQEDIVSGRLTMGHARALLGLESAAQMDALRRKIIDEGMTVRQTENAVKNQAAKTVTASKKAQKDIFTKDLEKEMARKLGAKVEIRPGKKGGKLIISYYSLDDLERLKEMQLPKVQGE
ncbi:MAG: ParB/RepB/Spo0J family partition protein [Candidatus Nitrohelix vancouverensis]|uniref:ParB/RepB/Spo0J family partition protein n=1 Tax=Candidatus Nitrohelix vancouverensis TaxID=2705534 RepID=A0A7T0G2T5_9BACT|nr:MAG: ParB/RepB/Spo0J family partition protein [Candidatus Nitrohelix vancouverensis]